MTLEVKQVYTNCKLTLFISDVDILARWDPNTGIMNCCISLIVSFWNFEDVESISASLN
jgi:hypothetical protein